MAPRSSWATGGGSNRRVDAEDSRAALGALVVPGDSAVDARQGLRPGPGNPGLVTQTGTPGINVLVNAYQGLVTATRATSGTAPYVVTEPAQLTLPILDIPADPSLQRNDLVIFRQTDTYYGDGVTDEDTLRVSGDPGAGDPSLAAYPDYLPLARVRVTANATTITDAMIDDLRPGWVVALGGILPVEDADDRATLTVWDGLAIYRRDRNWIEIHDGAGWRVQNTAVCSSTADRDSAITSAYNGQLAFTTDTNRLWIRRSGSWVALPDMPLFQGRQIVAQNLAVSGTFYNLTFTAEDKDSHGGHSTSSNPERYVAPLTGTYELKGGCAFAANATGIRVLHWAKNGTQIPGGDLTTPSVGAGAVTRAGARTIFVDLTASDYVTLQAMQDSGGALSTYVTSPVQATMTVEYKGG
ncbi:hypothetical protein [Saccharothrix sp. HUAS TT1]|uniref:hypothetical protein n=1 Tax=unclassified Saccharothrix TaxID=2593673 RepID=UPI00345C3E7E